MTADAQWEARCRRCGRCCFEKLDIDGRIFYTDRACDKLDLDSRLCTVYSQRQILRPGCTLLNEEIARLGVLPANCPYVAGIKDYVPPQLWDEEPQDR